MHALSSRRLKLCLSIFLLLCFSILERVFAGEVVLMSYGGHNETIGPYWVAVDKGLYQKHGIDARLLQVRNAQISLTALVSGEVPTVLPSIANVLSGLTAGAKLGCVAFPIKGVSRELVVRPRHRFAGSVTRQDHWRAKYRRRFLAANHDVVRRGGR